MSMRPTKSSNHDGSFGTACTFLHVEVGVPYGYSQQKPLAGFQLDLLSLTFRAKAKCQQLLSYKVFDSRVEQMV